MALHIIEKTVNLSYPLGHHLHCLIAQIPNHLRQPGNGTVMADPELSWRQVKSVLDVAVAGEGNLKKLHFLLFPEVCIPFSRFDEMLETIRDGFRPNTVTMFGMEYVPLKTYRGLLERFKTDNAEAVAFVDRDLDSGEIDGMPVNWCCIVVKEADGNLRVFLEAKTHPFSGEESLDLSRDLYRGRHFYLFRCSPSCFNFMALICFDYLYRSLWASNIRQIVDHANRLYFSTKQGLDALFVIQCNPKPEHRAYRDVISGFYGEYLEDTPGVRETVTVFGNASAETSIQGKSDPGLFGHSFIVISRRHPLADVRFPEFSTDDFGGAPVYRLRFGSGTRLIYLNLPLHHELDPRNSRVPLKVHSIFRPENGTWTKIAGDEPVSAEPGP